VELPAIPGRLPPCVGANEVEQALSDIGGARIAPQRPGRPRATAD